MPQVRNLDEDAKASLVRVGYDDISEDYLRLANDAPDTHRRERTAALLATLPAGASVLEAGWGAGMPVAAEILRKGHSYIGVDVSPRQVELPTKRVPHGDFGLGDILDQTFDAERFDGVIALYVITHVPREKWRSLFGKVCRWLKADGVLLVNVAHGDSPGWFEEDVQEFSISEGSTASNPRRGIT